MRLRALIPTLMMVLASSSGAASADTLFTSPSHTTPVPVGTTASIVAGTLTATGTGFGMETSNACTSSTLGLEIEQNDGAGVVGTLTGGTFTGCTLPVDGVFPWTFTVRGTGVASGANTVFTNTTWHDLVFTAGGVTASGTLTDASGSPPHNGVYTRQTTASGTSICFVLDNAGTLSGPVLANGRLDATYCLEGAATSWSLGTPTVTLPPATLYTTPAHTTRVATGSTATLASTSTTTVTLGASSVSVCASAVLTFTLGQNLSGLVGGTVTNGSFAGCSAQLTPTFPWNATLVGDGVSRNGNAVFAGTTLSNVRFDLLGALFSGTLTGATGSPPTTGAYLTQPSASGAPICLVLDRAGTVAGALASGVRVDGRYCFAGAAASTWSLT